MLDAGLIRSLQGEDADDIDRQKAMERVLAMFHPELRAILSRVPINYVPRIDLPPRPGIERVVGTYDAPSSGRHGIDIVPHDEHFEPTLLEELLHAANYEYEPYADEPSRNWPRLARALGTIPPRFRDDGAHAFSNFAEMALRGPRNMPDDLYRYFLPLRQGVPTD